MFKRYFGFMLVVFFVLGCSGYSDIIKKIPDVRFESFAYHRGIFMSSATITATGASIEGDLLTIDSLHITEDFGPFGNVSIQLKGYQRKISKSGEDN